MIINAGERVGFRDGDWLSFVMMGRAAGGASLGTMSWRVFSSLAAGRRSSREG